MKTISEIVDPSAWFDLLNFSEGAWVFLEGKEKISWLFPKGTTCRQYCLTDQFSGVTFDLSLSIAMGKGGCKMELLTIFF